LSDALLSGSQAAGPKLAAVWQPAPVLKALAKNPADRFKTGLEMAMALRECARQF